MNKKMAIAYKEALLAKEQGEVPVGTAVFCGERLVAAAHNLCEQKKDPTAHAELLAMQKAQEILGEKDLRGCELYVTLEPCAMCAGAAHLLKIKRIYFGAYDAKSGVLGGGCDLSQIGIFDQKPEIYGGIDEPICEALITDFFKSIRKD